MIKKILRVLLVISTLPLLGEVQKAKSESERIDTLSANCGAFGFSLYEALNESAPTNLVFSPYSIFSCLSMVTIGARETTATEMAKALHLLSYSRNELPIAASMLAKYLTVTNNESYSLQTANGLWLDQDTFVLADFRHAVEKGYQANVQSLDFSKTADAINTINEWIDNQTRHKISSLLQPDDINGSTRMVLTNAVCFQGKWQMPFDPKRTKEATFHLDQDSDVDVQMMEQVSSFPFMENEILQVLALPFMKKEERSCLACMILLPKKKSSISAVEEIFSQETLSGWIDQLKNETVSVKMPKFCLNLRSDLNDPLKMLGIENAFSTEANFSGINGMRDLFLSKVVHEAFFSLDEAGVVAAAATSASMNAKATPPTSPLRSFVADRPFLFVLVDLKSKLPLFVGKVQDPSLTSQCE